MAMAVLQHISDILQEQEILNEDGDVVSPLSGDLHRKNAWKTKV